jgi:hypothetical protein
MQQEKTLSSRRKLTDIFGIFPLPFSCQENLGAEMLELRELEEKSPGF